MSTMHFVMYANSNFLSGDEGSRGGEMTSENQYSWSYQISSSWSYFSILQHNIVQWDFLLRILDTYDELYIMRLSADLSCQIKSWLTIAM